MTAVVPDAGIAQRGTRTVAQPRHAPLEPGRRARVLTGPVGASTAFHRASAALPGGARAAGTQHNGCLGRARPPLVGRRLTCWEGPCGTILPSLIIGRTGGRIAYGDPVTRTWHARWFATLGVGRAAALAVSAGTSLLLKAETTGFPESLKFLASAIQWTKSWAWVLIPTALLLAAGFTWTRKKIGDPAVIDVVHTLLTEYRDKVISDRSTNFEHHHRVTLFRYKEWALVWRKWPWNGWLIPEIRSGEMTRNPSCRFRASSDNPEKAEGVAGMAWVCNRDIEITGLPDVSFPNASQDAVETYAGNTGLTATEIRRMKPHARAFYAFRVHVKGKLWGVIVIDSKSSTVQSRAIEKQYDAIAPSLSVLLPRI